MDRRRFLATLAGMAAASTTSYFLPPLGGWGPVLLPPPPLPRGQDGCIDLRGYKAEFTWTYRMLSVKFVRMETQPGGGPVLYMPTDALRHIDHLVLQHLSLGPQFTAADLNEIEGIGSEHGQVQWTGVGS